MNKIPFDKIMNFHDGYFRVVKDGKYNHVDIYGKLISKQWYDDASDFTYRYNVDLSGKSPAYASVKLGDKWNIIDVSGNCISDEWFDEVAYMTDDGVAKIKINGKINYIDYTGKLFFDLDMSSSIDYATSFKYGMGIIRIEENCHAVNIHGDIVTKGKEYENIQNFDGDVAVAVVYKNRKFNLIDEYGEELSPVWYDIIGTHSINGFFSVMNNHKWNFLSDEGELIGDLWFDDVEDFYNGRAKVKLNGKWNYVFYNGKLLSERWFDNDVEFGPYMVVTINGKKNIISCNGKLIYDDFAGF